MAQLQGRRAVRYLTRVATNPDWPPVWRHGAVGVLCELGTEEGDTAFLKLRDAAFDKPGAPERKTSYTHAEKMAETIDMVARVIPYDDPNAQKPPPVNPASAWVDEAFATGTIRHGSG